MVQRLSEGEWDVIHAVSCSFDFYADEGCWEHDVAKHCGGVHVGVDDYEWVFDHVLDGAFGEVCAWVGCDYE